MLNTTAAPVVSVSSGMTLLWLPSFLVGSVMLGFLGLSFSKHVRRVRRKKQILWDYKSLHLHMKRCRISANLCNTYSIPLQQLASSVRMHIVDESDVQTRPFRSPTLRPVEGGVAACRKGWRNRRLQRNTFGDTLSPDEEECVVDSLDWDDSVRVRVDLLCDRCREHLVVKPIFYISEDSQSLILGDVTSSQILKDNVMGVDHSSQEKSIKTRLNHSTFISRAQSLASEDEGEHTKSRIPLIQRVPTVTVTDMSDIEMDSFNHDTVSLDSLGLSSESIPMYNARQKGKTKILLSADETVDCHDVLLRDPDDADRRQPLIVSTSLPSDSNKVTKHKDFLKFFSKRKPRKSSKKSKKPVLKKQDKIVPSCDPTSKSMDDVNRNSFDRENDNLIERRKLFAGRKGSEQTATIDSYNEFKPGSPELTLDVGVGPTPTTVYEATSQRSLNNYHSSQFVKRQNYRDVIQEKYQNRSHDGVIREPGCSVISEQATLNKHGAEHCTENFDSLKKTLLLLPALSIPLDGKVNV